MMMILFQNLKNITTSKTKMVEFQVFMNKTKLLIINNKINSKVQLLDLNKMDLDLI